LAIRTRYALSISAAVLSLHLFAPARAEAQVGMSATAESEYRFRGVALTNGKPDVRLGLSYDHPSGGYAGASVIVGEGARGDIHALGYIGYVGYARRTGGGLTLDVGATNARVVDSIPVRVTVRTPQNYVYTGVITYRYQADYSEVYAGVIKGGVSAHLYVSPNYLGEGLRTAYLDVSGAVRPADRVRLFWHAGLLVPLGGRTARDDRSLRYDLRAGVALELGPGELQLAWTTVGSAVEYPIGYPQKRDALVLSATTFF
jgi:uncharacterized protein (TIGR02001 family)